jgi:hypothetical protein
MMTNLPERRLEASRTLLALALLVALGIGVAAVTRTQPLIAVSADALTEPSRSPGGPR